MDSSSEPTYVSGTPAPVQQASAHGIDAFGSTGPAGLDPSPIPAAPQHKPNRFFFGRFGLRAGYGIAIIAIIWSILGTIGGISAIASQGRMPELMHDQAYAKAHPGAPKPKLHFDFSPSFILIQDSVSFLPLFGVCWLFSRGERRPLRAYGIGGYRVADVIPGAVWGVVVMSTLVAVLRGLHLLVFDGRALSGSAIFVYGLEWLVAFAFVGLAEEYGFRGYVQYTLMRGLWGLAERISAVNARAIAFWLAASLFSLLFAAVHLSNGGENPFGIVQVFIAGITFAYVLWRTGSLWWAIGFHATWDWAQSFLYGVADSGNISVGRLFITHPQGRTLLSGGADGPEGSIFATVALLLTIVIVRFTTRPGLQPALEQAPKPVETPVPSLLHNSVA